MTASRWWALTPLNPPVRAEAEAHADGSLPVGLCLSARECQAAELAEHAILARYKGGLSWQRIADELADSRITTPTGSAWHANGVAEVVRILLGSDALSPHALRRRDLEHRLTKLDRRHAVPASTEAYLEEPAAGTDGRRRAGAGPGLQLKPEELPDAILDYLDTRSLTKAAGTVSWDTQALRRLVGFVGAQAFLDRLDAAALSRYQRALPTSLPHPGTRRLELSCVRVFLRYAHAEGSLTRDLSGRITLPRVPKGAPRAIPAQLLPALFAKLPRATGADLEVRALVHFLLSTGCRISEALSVDRDDVTADGAVRVRTLKSSAGMRTVLLLPHANTAVAEYLASRYDTCPALFASSWRIRAGRLTDEGARAMLRRLRHRLADDPAMALFTSPHVARHTLATMLSEVTPDARLVGEVLGHRSMRALSVYTEVTDHRKRAAFAPGSKFAELLHGNVCEASPQS
jgi:site-specific recombinase XerD